MKLSLRAKQLTKKLTLLSTAFVLAVSTLTASVPFILSSVASAAIIQDGTTWRVNTAEDLKAALSSATYDHITLDSDIVLTESLIINRSVKINANNKTITGPNLSGVWVTNGNNYGIKIYNTTGVKIHNLRVTGANVGVQVNGSQVEFSGTTRVSGNAFGGIELSRGSGVSRVPAVRFSDPGTLQNTTEVNTKPTVWAVGEATVTSPLAPLTKATHIVEGQTQYYLDAANANVVATNTSNGETFASVQAAINDSNTVAGNVITLNKNVELAGQSILVNKAVTIDGANYTVSTPFNRGVNGVANAAFIVLTSGVTIKNVTAQGNGNGTNAAHGIVVDKNLNNVTLQNVIAKDNAAGVIVNGSRVTIDGIHTENNNWYGINVDRDGAVLTIKGAVSHSEGERAHIFTDKRTTNAVVNDPGKLYVRWWSGEGYKYVLDTSKPAVTVFSANGTFNPTALSLSASDDQRLNRYDISIWRSTGEQVNVWGDWVTTATFQGQFTQQLASLGEGSYIAYATVADILGKSTNAAPVTFTIDHIAPVAASFTYSNNNGNALTNQDVTVTLTTNEPVQAPEGWTPVSSTVFTKSHAVAGKYSVVLTDLAGNVSAAQKYEVKRIDKKAPVFNITNGAVLSSSSFDVVVTEENLGNTVEVDGVDLAHSNTKPNYKVTVTGEGIHTVVATDKAGNSASVSFTLDSINPVINGDVLTRVGNVFTPNFTVQDATKVTLEWAYVSGPTGGVVVSDPTIANPTLTAILDGSYTYSLKATDEAGNSFTKLISFNYTTPAAPVDPDETEDDNSTPAVDDEPEFIVLTQTPTITGPVNPASVLGLNATGPSVDNAVDTNNQDVEGASTFEKAAQAVDADNTDGTAMGLAWYWWVLIAAGLALLGWWIAAAIRRRQAE